ncbi:YadA-like family protein [Oceanivirga salmonicida]|uniref:YadA-like family protein n=1 Tax=Oceanivirga salmonicida TaxID=1769291 RepID=UPI0008302B6A|nr:YadA-like family protein [Oceanivirga salmonicida]
MLKIENLINSKKNLILGVIIPFLITSNLSISANEPQGTQLGDVGRLSFIGDNGKEESIILEQDKLRILGDGNIETETGTNGKININLKNVITLGKKIKIDGEKGEITGLTNLRWDGNAIRGRAATEDQLKIVYDRIKINEERIDKLKPGAKASIKIESANNDEIVVEENSNTYKIGLSDKIKTKLSEIGKGEINAQDMKTISGKTLREYLKGNYYNKEELDKKVSEKILNNDELKKDLEKSFVKIDASNININEWTKKLSEKSNLEKPENSLVTDTKVKKYLENNYYNKKSIDEKVANVKQLSDKVNETEGKLSGGIATAIAIGNIPQVSGNHLVSLGFGASYYNKTGGFALGLSGTTPSNIIVYKLSAGVDTKKTFGVSAGVNINFVKNKVISRNITSVKNEEMLNAKISDLENKHRQEVEKYRRELDKNKKEIDELKGTIKELIEKLKSDSKILENNVI